MRVTAFVVLVACLFSHEVLASPSAQQPHVARETMLEAGEVNSFPHYLYLGSHEAAVVAKHLIHTSVTGVLGSTYPSDHPHTPDYPYAILEVQDPATLARHIPH